MAVQRKGLVAPSDPILTKTAKPISPSEITSPKIQEDIEKLLNLSYGEQKNKRKPILVGLAAPQAGISKRIILVDIGADGHGGVSNLQVFINPRITYMSDEKKEWYEGCFSTDRVCGIVERAKRVRVASFDTLGRKSEQEYTGYVARILHGNRHKL
jgi:peptide deformylase